MSSYFWLDSENDMGLCLVEEQEVYSLQMRRSTGAIVQLSDIIFSLPLTQEQHDCLFKQFFCPLSRDLEQINNLAKVFQSVDQLREDLKNQLPRKIKSA